MRRFIGTTVGKTIRSITKLRGTGGQALPGLVVERLFPSYLANMLGQLPEGVVVITGTNGKTTTTKMVVELLRANGKRVLTNPTGSNFTRGIISSLAHQAKASGHLPFDIGVFELDEAYARHFVAQVKPRWVLALNVMRDQLDRFGELDTAARLIGSTMEQATEGIVTNIDDARLMKIGIDIANERGLHLRTFGVAPKLRSFFPGDDELVSVGNSTGRPRAQALAHVTLMDFTGQDVTFREGNISVQGTLKITGQHNFQNAAAGLALTRVLIPKVSIEKLAKQLSTVTPAFGRGQQFSLRNGSKLELLLIKNPAGFRQTLISYPVAAKPVMIAINDNYADGRDVSWLWDVDVSVLEGKAVVLTSGTRAVDMALRLSYDHISVKEIEPGLEAALRAFCNQPGDKLLITTYTAMLRFHALLKKEAGKTL